MKSYRFRPECFGATIYAPKKQEYFFVNAQQAETLKMFTSHEETAMLKNISYSTKLSEDIRLCLTIPEL